MNHLVVFAYNHSVITFFGIWVMLAIAPSLALYHWSDPKAWETCYHVTGASVFNGFLIASVILFPGWLLLFSIYQNEWAVLKELSRPVVVAEQRRAEERVRGTYELAEDGTVRVRRNR